MFASLIERFRQRPELGRPSRRAQVLGDVVAGVLANTLASDFQRVGDLFWMSDQRDHLRYLLKFQAMKGMTFSACWGVSVDFVPTLGGGKLKWKRTPKSVAFDLCIDPIDLSGHIPDWCSFYSNDRDYHVRRAASAAVRAARLDWSKITTLSDVADTFERRSRMVFKRFSLENYVQTDLAWGLVLIALGRTDAGHRHLDAFCRQFAIAPETAILTKAKGQAAAIAAG